MAAIAPPAPASVSSLGRLLRQWRRARGLSQLELALSAGVSAKHLSFVETGRAQPGREIVLRLASALDLSLRDRNAALTAAGYAPIYAQGNLQSPEMASVVRAVDSILRQQEPYPALVMDRFCNVQRTNAGGARFLRFFLGDRVADSGRPLNLFRLLLCPDGLRPFVSNWPEVARMVVIRLRREVAATPASTEANAFLDEMLAQPGIPEECRLDMPDLLSPPVVATELRKDGAQVRMFNTITMLQELRIECSFPADAESEAFLRSL
jgi:transcriptional regulator with XRE-family HTH domain